MDHDSCDVELDDDKVRKHSFLYDKKCQAFKKPVFKDQAWSSIASILAVGISGDKAKHRWKNLRDRFMKELKKVENTSASGAGNSGVYCPKWIFYEELLFLREHCERRRTTSNYPASTPAPDQATEDDDTQSEGQTQSESQLMEAAGEIEYLDAALESAVPHEGKGSRKKRKSDIIDTKIEDLVDQVGEVIAAIGTKKSHFEPFCSSLAEKLDRLPAHVARALETKYTAEVNALLDQYEME